MNLNSNILAGIVISIGILTSGVIISQAPTNPYTNEISQLQKKLNKASDEQADANNQKPTVKNISLATAIADTNLKKGMDLSDTLMTNLYDWDSGKKYLANKADVKNQLTDENTINTIMPSPYDNQGNNKIDNLNITSNLSDVTVYADDLNSTKFIIAAKTYSESNDTDNQNATKPISNNQVYEASYNPTINRFTSLKHLGTETLDSSTDD